MSRLTGRDCFGKGVCNGTCGIEGCDQCKHRHKINDKLANYEDIGEPAELVKPVRCGECKQAEDVAENPGDYIAPYWCHELDKRMSAIDYCSYGEQKEDANNGQ